VECCKYFDGDGPQAITAKWQHPNEHQIIAKQMYTMHWNTKTAGTGKHLCGGEILGCQINGNMAAGTDHCENLQIGVGRKKGGRWEGNGKMEKGNKETAAGQNQMKSNLDKITNRPMV